MTSSISWIDPDGLAGTLQRIGVTRMVQEPPRAALPLVSKPVTDAPTPTVTSPVPIEVPILAFEPGEGSLRDRLASFIDWLAAAAGIRTAFLVDHDGLPLVDRQADPDLIAIASGVMQLVDTINGRLLFPLGNSVTLELEEGQLLLMTVETSIGKYIVGQVVDGPLPKRLTDSIAEALKLAFLPSAESDFTIG